MIRFKAPLAVQLFSLWFALTTPGLSAENRVLVYTRNGPTADGKKGFIHDNVASSVEAIRKLGVENGFATDESADPTVFTDDQLKKYAAVIFSNSNNKAFDTEEQKAAFQRYIHGGGGFVGIHSACGSERNWPWYGDLLGGTFVRHPKFQPFTIRILDRAHPSTSFFEKDTWAWEDEFYFLKNMPAGLHVLLAGDLDTLKDANKEKDRDPGYRQNNLQPLAWCHTFEGGRAWYTALGHKKEQYTDPLFRKHILGGIMWAMEKKPNRGGWLRTIFSSKKEKKP